MGEYETRQEMLAAFGPFAAVFEPIGENKAPYLSLLHLHDSRVAEVVNAIRVAATHELSHEYIMVLLRDAGWRPHLVGSVATYYRTSESAIDLAWRALDAGSWVQPQLAAMLSLVHSQFLDKAILRLESGCPLERHSTKTIDDPTVAHVVQGPNGDSNRSSKMTASLVALLREDYPNDERVVQLQHSRELLELIAEDEDNSGEVAKGWRERFLRLVG